MEAAMARPSTAPVRKQVNLTAETAARVVEYRFDHRLATESEAIRRLIELGLEAAKARPQEPKGKPDA
jgi:hypothetical protein